MTHRATGSSGNSRRGLPLSRALHVPEEILFFARSAAYGIFIAIVYWFLTYETAGTVLLGGFGAASAALVGLLLWKRAKEAPTADWDPTTSRRPDGPFGNESAAVPAPTVAPLELGLGLALLLLVIPFGPAMGLAAIVPLAAGALGWFRAAQAEPVEPDEESAPLRRHAGPGSSAR
jgi:hypothetical protein